MFDNLCTVNQFIHQLTKTKSHLQVSPRITEANSLQQKYATNTGQDKNAEQQASWDKHTNSKFNKADNIQSEMYKKILKSIVDGWGTTDYMTKEYIWHVWGENCSPSWITRFCSLFTFVIVHVLLLIFPDFTNSRSMIWFLLL